MNKLLAGLFSGVLMACTASMSWSQEMQNPEAQGLNGQGLKIQGEWQQGAVLRGQVVPGTQVTFFDRKVRVAEDGVFVIGLGRDAPASVTLKTKQSGQEQVHSFAVKQRQYRVQRVDGVPPKTVNPPAEALARIRKESALARKARKVDSVRQDFRQAFQWPLLGPISGVYGSQRVYNGEPRRPHFGVDVARPTGTVVVAPVSGKVLLAYDDMFFSGGTLIVDHGHGLSSTFIHLSKILVKDGEVVEQGQPIAEVGATGRVTGPHLDWRMNWFKQRVDPQLLVGPMPDYE
jgi:murein DD-endopeptidase MepM/ murein hydrolase activator NlpD